MTIAFRRCLHALVSSFAVLHCGAPATDEAATPDTTSTGAGGSTTAESAPQPPAVTPGAPVINAPGNGTTPAPIREAPPAPALEQPPPRVDESLPAANETPPPVEEAPPTRCAGPTSLAAGNQTVSLEHDGVERTYIVHVPSGLDAAAPVPLVVDMHGLTSSAGAQASLSGWRAKADEEGFIVVHPQGLNASWNGGDLCCGQSQSQGVDDEGFIRAMVAQVKEDACVDPKRVYATGLSNGGAMSHLLGCNAADLFAATAPVSMGNGTRPCAPSRPISVVMTRGTQDALVSFEGGLFPSAEADFEQWAELNGCQGEPQAAGELCRVFSECEGGVEVKLCAIEAGHVLYNNSQDFSVPDVVWETFERQALP